MKQYTAEDIIVVDIIGEVVTKVAEELQITINYTYGQSIQILEELERKNNVQGTKYPLFALFQPFPVRRGNGLYGTPVVRRLSIATLTNLPDDAPTRYTKTFKPILFPCYYSFLRQLVKHRNVMTKDVDYVTHEYYEAPGIKPVSGMSDYVDQIVVVNLDFKLSQKKYCSS